MAKITIEVTEQELKDLKIVRNYFGEHDVTMLEHFAYSFLDNLHKKLCVGETSHESSALPIPDVINSAVPEWLDVGTRAEAKFTWESHKIVNDNLRVKAIKIIMKRAEDCGYKIGIKKATELLQQHCL